MKLNSNHIELTEVLQPPSQDQLLQVLKKKDEEKLEKILKILLDDSKKELGLNHLQKSLEEWESDFPDLNYRLARMLWLSPIPHDLKKIAKEKSEILFKDAAARGSLDAMLEMAHRTGYSDEAIAWYAMAFKKSSTITDVLQTLNQTIEKCTVQEFLKNTSLMLKNMAEEKPKDADQYLASALLCDVTAFRFLYPTERNSKERSSKERSSLRKTISENIKSCSDDELLKKIIAIFLIKHIHREKKPKKTNHESKKYLTVPESCFEKIKSKMTLGNFTDPMINLYQVAITSTKENENIALLLEQLFDKFSYSTKNEEHKNLNKWLLKEDAFNTIQNVAFDTKIVDTRRIKALLLVTRIDVHIDDKEENYKKTVSKLQEHAVKKLIQINDNGVIKTLTDEVLKQQVWRVLAAYFAKEKSLKSIAIGLYKKVLLINKELLQNGKITAPGLTEECDNFEKDLTQRSLVLKKKDTLFTPLTNFFEYSPGKQLEVDLKEFQKFRKELETPPNSIELNNVNLKKI
jgi:hypothetical protein